MALRSVQFFSRQVSQGNVLKILYLQALHKGATLPITSQAIVKTISILTDSL